MTPSFFSLFKRGRYCRKIPSEEADASEGAKRERQELERFVVASLAFAFKHDPQFGLHFFNSICNPTETPRASTDGLEIKIEDEDLDLVITDRHRSCLYIIEAKVSASLEPRQNPTNNSAFFAPDGYGTKAEQKFKSADHFRYIVLGAHEHLNCETIGKRERWSFCQRAWGDLAKDWPRSKLAEDLRDFLADVQIAPFMIQETEGVLVDTNLKNAAEANMVLVSACKALDAGSHSLDLNFEKESGCWHFGMNVHGIGKCGQTVNRIKPLVNDANPVAWFGYEGPPTNAATVWFYSGDKKLAASLASKLMTFSPEISADSHVFIKKNGNENDGLEHVKWFSSVFEAAARI
jgi:hypothetical protein